MAKHMTSNLLGKVRVIKRLHKLRIETCLLLLVCFNFGFWFWLPPWSDSLFDLCPQEWRRLTWLALGRKSFSCHVNKRHPKVACSIAYLIFMLRMSWGFFMSNTLVSDLIQLLDV